MIRFRKEKILIDDQQRVTALMTAISGIEVIINKYQKMRMIISFNLIKEKFAARLILLC